jgi:hypothetical protein
MQLSEYEGGTTVEVTVNAPTLPNGVTLSAISYSVLDNDGTELVSNQSVSTGDVVDGVLPISIASAHNTLAATPSREVRTVEITFMDSDTNDYSETVRYIIHSGETLTKLTNSFGTLNELILAKSQMAFLTELDDVDIQTFSTNAIEAWRRLSRMNYRYKIIDSDADQLSYLSRSRNGYVYVKEIANIDQNEFDSLPAAMRTALIRAQVVETAQIITGDPIEERRNAGIVSETIGESKQFFNNRPPLKFPVSRKALKEIEGYYYFSNVIARV